MNHLCAGGTTVAAGIPNLDGLDDLARLRGVDTRPTLARVITDLYVQKRAHTLDEETHYTELVLRLLDGVEQAQHQFGVVSFLIERMRGFLDVEIGEHARERRPRVDAALPRKLVQSIEIGSTEARHSGARPLGDNSNYPARVSGPLTNEARRA